MGFGVEHGRVAVGVREGLGQRSLGQANDLAQHVAGNLAVHVAEVVAFEGLVESEELEEVELEVPKVALVMAHCSFALQSVVRSRKYRPS